MLSFATVLAALVAVSFQQSADVAVKQPAPFPQSGEAPIEAGPFYPPIPGDVNPLPNVEVPFGPRQPPPLPPNFEGGPAPLPPVPSFPGGEGPVVPFPGPGPQPLPGTLAVGNTLMHIFANSTKQVSFVETRQDLMHPVFFMRRN